MRLEIFVPYANRPGLFRRTLKRIGPTWQSSPVRRFIQATCFLLFGYLFFYACWPYGVRDYQAALTQRQIVPATSFLAIDPLVSLSTAIAARTWVWSLTWAAGILLVCVFFPRGFCGYLCPLGTLIDLFDWGIGKRTKRFALKGDGWWVHIKYYLLAATLVSSVFGVLISGFVAAIPVLTRGFQFTLAPLQMGTLLGFYKIPPINAGHIVSIVLFIAVLGLGLLRPRFWCRYVCPTGALFSLANIARASERKVEQTCINCNKCVEICPFDAIKADFTTRTDDCTLCQTCGGVCPTHAIKFVDRWNNKDLKAENDPPTNEIKLSRRGLLTGAATGAIAASGIGFLFRPAGAAVIRPPGSVGEKEFLDLCIRCGECFKACPFNVLQPMGFEGGINALWTPRVVPTWEGCDSGCNNCGQVCPTGAIRALPLEEKRAARMGLAVVNTQTCLPHAGTEACQLCVDECTAAGYNAIEFTQAHLEYEEDGTPKEDSGFRAPRVLADKCVGCGLCQTRCHMANVTGKHKLAASAITVQAGGNNEDRMSRGSYVQLRIERRKAKEKKAVETKYGE